MPPRLKVYATRIGFHDVIVAAPSQKAALAAWDVRENLFANDAASVAEDPAAVEAALAAPGTVLRRAAGTSDPFLPEAEAGLPSIPDRPGGKPAPPPKKPPDRSRLIAAESALEAFEREAAEQAAALDREQQALDERRAQLAEETEARRATLRADVERRKRKLDG